MTHLDTQNTIYGPQSRGSPNCGNLETPTWEFQDKIIFEC
jgi:hypothetical protein